MGAFPNPAQEYADSVIDLNEWLVKKPSATFFMRAKGHSMRGAGIFDGSLLVVDRSLEAKDGRICVCRWESEFVFRRFYDRGAFVLLKAEAVGYPDLKIPKNENFEVWGVVRSVITDTLK